MISKELFLLLQKVEKGSTLTNKEKEFLFNEGYIDVNEKITDLTLKTLEPFKVKRAVIMGAGFGSRMVPLTLVTPKPLVKVNGVMFIETLIDKLLDKGIDDIIIVRGYLKEKFDILLTKYPFLKFVDNDKYDKENNISSAILIAHLLKDSYLCEADFYVTGDNVIEKYQYDNNYLCSKVDETSDWCFKVDKNGNAYDYKKGDKDCYQAYGISYWPKKEGEVLFNKLNEMYKEKKYRQEFWEMCIFDVYKECFNIKPRCIDFNEIVEIDSYDELVQIDKSYLK